MEPKSVVIDPVEVSWIQAAGKLSDLELAERRARLGAEPENVRLRVEVLIGLCRRTRQEVDPDLLAEQLEWMLAQRPRSDAARVACGILSVAQDPALRERLGGIVWRAATVARSPLELEFLSSYFSSCEPERSKELLRRARALDPGNEARWDELLRQSDEIAAHPFNALVRNWWRTRRSL